MKDCDAVVTVLDNLGNPAESVEVSGSFTVDYAETVNAATDATGIAVLTTTTTNRGGVSFCVDSLDHLTLTYDSAANAQTCGGF